MTYKYKLEDVEGIGPATAEKLRAAGITTVEALAITPVRTLVEIADISEDKAAEITQNARNLLSIRFTTAKEVLSRRSNIGYITTGSKALDSLLGKGIETQAITEVIGEFGSGKTQLCHQLSVTVQLPIEKGGLSGKALYIDTEGTFRPERIVSIAKSYSLDPEKTLENIIYARAYNSDHQILLAEEATNLIPNENIRLIVVDSVISHFRSEYPGREVLAMRQQKLNKHLHQLSTIADIFNVAVVVTNQIQSAPDVFFGNPNKPAGGNILAHGSTYRLWLRKSKENRRIARIIDSPMHPESECIFAITSKGITDVEED
ncbi:MAG: DNA repair and recombination protein RadA [Candidatus Methanomethylicia archaeon]|uniref:DNA repair and recombination protein RadA n=1 Tax=Thermoproteota archaeon TaxID=2056631 RepID=A0A520KE27_9CREN|nr:DNA repair and recombination protein RadA [Candidatus Methanomethylicia archaeon]MCQ5341174.1 DNA repair and recombination protein RadA [Candidatus Methanomethylicia archaeon]NHV45822.1 DNA repair and recombination protein RadA [Candidatus Verstraetearchaeota archaeon]RZN55252.1 MAG: DNA repair and recombination protein RadA [Candidatus Verstraetearchaeota archaeon]TDA38877.1 MAG: DNA repair and recombination protein RadA [Candidatus Verstraetearchaeota archaeon]